MEGETNAKWVINFKLLVGYVPKVRGHEIRLKIEVICRALSSSLPN